MTNSHIKRVINIELVTRRDLSYILSNLREMDKHELFCQYPHDEDSMNAKILLNAVLNAGEYKRIATLDGQPVLAFGMQEVSPKRFVAWAFGTDKTRRVIPASTRFMLKEFLPVMKDYANRIQAESISTHKQAHNWLKGLGAKPVVTLKKVGKHGEDFILFERLF